jgi:hypothetical protein
MRAFHATILPVVVIEPFRISSIYPDSKAVTGVITQTDELPPNKGR